MRVCRSLAVMGKFIPTQDIKVTGGVTDLPQKEYSYEKNIFYFGLDDLDDDLLL